MTAFPAPPLSRWHILYIDSWGHSHNLFPDIPQGASQALVMRQAKKLMGLSGVRGKTLAEPFRDSEQQQQYSFRPYNNKGRYTLFVTPWLWQT